VLAVVTPVLVALLKLVWSCFRIEVRGDAQFKELAEEGQPVVFAFWHEGLLVVCWYVAKLLNAGIKMTFLISPSVDGEVGVQILAHFGSKAVRGSARRSGAAALRRLVAAIRRDRMSPCITLDGSKGPRRYCKLGAVSVARLAQVPIVPLGFAARRSWRLRSWDRHLVPKPLSRVLILVGEPYSLAKSDNDDAMEEARQDLEDRVNQLMTDAERTVGAAHDQTVASTGQPEEAR
jgi:lysophospholipid acyltransferase (LPLAT)-like uncharacterized protein